MSGSWFAHVRACWLMLAGFNNDVSSKRPAWAEADSGRGTCCTRLGKEANKGDSVPSFAPHCISDGATRVVVGSVMRAAISGHRADELGVHGKLYAVKRQAAADYLDAPCIVDRPIDVHGGQCDVAPDTRPGFLADAGDGAFEGYNAREASTPEVEHAARWSPYASSAQRQE
eukprot:s4279_g4.t1